ncbi:outer membrane beta-barrel protein [Rhodoplanes roseus]|uniref:outer membrane beta-barrel protein n=1 Tax=Rhodoplanes roseus TaxID=29409 RepID=UPI0014739815|nr:outer membrane beta-barrel protein [Rhodoplanes roseus]
MPRPCSRLAAWLGSGAIVGAGLIAASTSAALAQTPELGTDPATEPGLFAPAPAGSRPLPQRFRPGSATAAPADGRTVFGGGEETAPSGSRLPTSTGTTSFDSRNARRFRLPQSLTQRQQEAARLKRAPVSAVLVPGTNQAVTSVVVPGRLRRRGGPDIDTTSRLNIPTTATILRRFPNAEVDPFAPTGIRAGAFLLRPAIEITTGFDTNPTRIQGLPGSSLTTVSPELIIRSDWQRHQLNADLRGTYTWYGQTYPPVTENAGTVASTATPEIIDRPTMDSRVNGRFDVDKLSHFDGEARAVVSTDNPGSPNVQTGLKRFPLVTTVGATFGYTQAFNRLEVTTKGTLDHQVYQDSLLADGTTYSNADREYNQYGGAVRVGYELKPGLRPFVETGADTRIHAQKVDRNGYDRDSTGTFVKVGSTFEFSRKLVGEASLGWLWRFYEDDALTNMSGLTIDAALAYTLSDLTLVKLVGTTRAAEIIVPGMSGVFSRDISVQVDHAFRRWLIGTALVGTGIDDYVGSDRLDHRYFASVSMLYKLSREVALKSELRQDWLRSNIQNADWSATRITVGVRLQR